MTDNISDEALVAAYLAGLASGQTAVSPVTCSSSKASYGEVIPQGADRGKPLTGRLKVSYDEADSGRPTQWLETNIQLGSPAPSITLLAVIGLALLATIVVVRVSRVRCVRGPRCPSGRSGRGTP